jgi:opacity protein-like surface antigen
MKKLLTPTIILFFFLLVAPASAQRLMIKPFYGYLLPQMSDVNERIENQIEGWRELLGVPVPSPEKIAGNGVFGAQVQYQLNDDYFLALNASHYQKKVATEYSNDTAPTPENFLYEREVETTDVTVHLNYYFNYSPDNRFNKYLGIGVGLIFAKARSNTQSSFVTNPSSKVLLASVDTQGDFSGNSVTAAFSGGLDFGLSNSISLWGEAGYQYAKVGQMEGTVSRPDNQNAAFTTTTSFDFSGFYFRAGLGIGLPF